MIETKNLVKIYEMGKVTVHALKGINISVDKGEFVSVMGPSGSGKSTLLHLIGLLDEPTSGEVVIDGFNASKLTDVEKTRFRLTKIGFVFQFYNLIPELTALENITLLTLLLNKTQRECETKSEELLKVVGLSHRAGHLPSELSGGEQQRISIARALVNEPVLLLADEPTGNLDSKSAKEVVGLFRKLNKELNQTIIMVTHEEELGQQADRIIALRDGLLV